MNDLDQSLSLWSAEFANVADYVHVEDEPVEVLEPRILVRPLGKVFQSRLDQAAYCFQGYEVICSEHGEVQTHGATLSKRSGYLGLALLFARAHCSEHRGDVR